MRVRSLFFELILIVFVSILVMVVLFSVALTHMNHQQQKTNDQFFQIETNSISEQINTRLSELPIAVGQICQSKALQKFLLESDVLLRYQYRQYLVDMFCVLEANSNHIWGIDLFSLNGNRYSFCDIENKYINEIIEKYGLFSNENLEPHFFLLKTGHQNSYSTYAYLSPLYSGTSGSNIGVIVLYGSVNSLFVGKSENLDVELEDENGNSFPGSELKPNKIQTAKLNTTIFFHQKNAYIDESQKGFYTEMIRIVLFAVGTIIISAVFLMKKLTYPIKKLCQQIESVRLGQKERIDNKSNSLEINLLIDNMNGMLANIQQRNIENMQMQEKLHFSNLIRIETQLYALRNQINPHFLYNTLQTIKGIAIYNNIPEIGIIVSNMVRIFRYSIKENPQTILSDELAIAEDYLEIMNARQQNRYSCEIQIANDMDSCVVPRMIIQPILENAVSHGFKNIQRKAEVKILCQNENGTLIITIADNGCGMSDDQIICVKERIAQPLFEHTEGKSSGIGLHNIHQRIRLRYGDSYGIELTKQIEYGLIVKIRLPIIKNSEEN